MGSSRTAAFPADVLLDTAVLTVLRSAAVTKFGASRGGLEFDPGRELRTLEYDGRRHKKATHDRTVGWDGCKITGTMLELSPANALALEPGATVTNLDVGDTDAGPPAVPAVDTRVITPKAADGLYVVGDYLEEPRLTYLRGNGGTFSIVFPFGLIETYKLQGQDKNEGEFPVTIGARAASDDPDDVAPFWFEITGPDIVVA